MKHATQGVIVSGELRLNTSRCTSKPATISAKHYLYMIASCHRLVWMALALIAASSIAAAVIGGLLIGGSL